MNPIAIVLAAQATRDHARSALPNAPTVPDPPEPSPAPARRALARGLRWAASRIEPQTV